VLLFLVIGVAAGLGASAIHPVLGGIVGALAAILTLWCLWFFRDPARIIPSEPGAIVSPADGVIVAVDRTPPPPEIPLPPDFRATCQRISIFMNVFDVHVNRAPSEGKVTHVLPRVGRFLNASFAKASEENERCSVVIETADGQHVVAVQIAGLVARRIICRIKPGAALSRAERFGLIRFGSRVDVFIPADAVPIVSIGQRATSGQTIIARRPQLVLPSPAR